MPLLGARGAVPHRLRSYRLKPTLVYIYTYMFYYTQVKLVS